MRLGRWDTEPWKRMAYPETDDSSLPDDKLDGLVRAVAAELLQLGYRPAEKPGHVLSETNVLRVVDPAIWKAMKEILAGREP